MTKIFCALLELAAVAAWAQATDAGSVRGTVLDRTRTPVPAAVVALTSVSTGRTITANSGSEGEFEVPNLPAGHYRLTGAAPGFQTFRSDLSVESGVPVSLTIQLELNAKWETVTVEASGDAVLQTRTAPTESVGRLLLEDLPSLSPDSGLNDSIIFTTAGVAADSNGFFHPLGDHAQVSFLIDGQPITDQRNKVFSTSIPANAIQSMEVISGSPSAEYGDKTSLVVNAVTRSGLGQKPSGSLLISYGSFGSAGEESSLAFGNSRRGNFLAVNSERTGRFLDTPEFLPMHDVGNTGTVFDRADYQTGGGNTIHLNVMVARNWMQIPNTYDQPAQDQRQKVVSFNVAPGYQRTLGGQGLFTVSAYVRRDGVDFYPSSNPFADSPATISQRRSLMNYGIHSDWSGAAGIHHWKAGVNAMQTKLKERFDLGLTDFAYNAPCLAPGSGAAVPGYSSGSECARQGLEANPEFLAGLSAYDLTRNGRPYHFSGAANINQLALFGEDTMNFGRLTLNLGLRYDDYHGLTTGGGFGPRASFSYLLRSTQTVIRGGFSHTIETPVNENLVASSSTGAGGLASNLLKGATEQLPIALGSRNQYDAGVQQRLGNRILLDVNYFRKYTRNAFDFDALFSTPVTFPIGWRQSKLDGISARISSVDFHGLKLYATMGHANARFFGPENGGLIFNSNLTIGAYRQDHDQVYQQNVNAHYQLGKRGWWTDFTWRYDSGLVVGAVNSLRDALRLTADQQTMIGFYCGPRRASLGNPIATCSSPVYGAERIEILPPDAENDDHNPPRTKARHILNVSAGSDNLFRSDGVRTTLRISVLNLSNQAALYNFLSPFGGTHWVQPRTYQAQLGWTF